MHRSKRVISMVWLAGLNVAIACSSASMDGRAAGDSEPSAQDEGGDGARAEGGNGSSASRAGNDGLQERQDAGGANGGGGATVGGEADAGGAGQGEAGSAGSGGADGDGGSIIEVAESCVPKMCGESCTGCGVDACRCNRVAVCERDDNSPLDCTQPSACPASAPQQRGPCDGPPDPDVCAYGDCAAMPGAGRTFARCVGGEWDVQQVGCDGFACTDQNGTAYCGSNEVCFEYGGGAPTPPGCVPHQCGRGSLSCDCIPQCNPDGCTLQGNRVSCGCGFDICP